MVRQGQLIALVVAFLIAVLVVGCGAGGTGNNDGRGGKRGAVTTEEETTAPEANRSKAQTAQEPTGLDEQVVSPLGQANVPKGFGEGSLWATDFQPISAACDDVGEPGEGPCSASASASPARGPIKTLLKRVDPQTGEVVAKIKVGRGALDIAADESSGAMWVASSHLPKTYGGYDFPKYSEDRNLTRVDPETNRVVEEIPIKTHSQYGGGAGNVAIGEGAVWVLSGDGNLLKVDPATNEIAARVSVGVSPSSRLAVYGGGVWAMGQAEGYLLVRVDPSTMHIVASEDIGPIPKIGDGGLAAGGGYVWFSSGEGLARVSP
jgi:DNA-binding beta-propeller fold protein YncE